MVTAGRGGRPRQGVLEVWANGEHVGTWSAAGGAHQFQYSQGWLASPHARPLSLSMLFTPGNAPHRGDVVRNFFDNLLPDNDRIRQRLREKFATGGTQAFELLWAIGRDCVGAVQLLPPGMRPEGFDRVEAEPLDDAGVEQALDKALSGGRLAGQEAQDEFRISIAGAQEKTALLWHAGRWSLPRGATPTTHIFKLPLGLIGNLRFDMRDSVENEWLCGRLLARLGLPVAESQLARFGRHKVLVVERFDRMLAQPPGAPGWIMRLPQEDFCQALGQPADLKYESAGGPGMQAILRQLQLGTRPQADVIVFLKAQLAFWLLAAVDGHAKNFSIFLERGGTFRLTPLYDVLSAWPIIGNGASQLHFNRAKLAMAVRSKNAHYNLREIHARHWEFLAGQSGAPGAFDSMVALALQMPQALDEVAAELPSDFPHHVFDTVRAGALRMAQAFIDEL